VQIFDHIDRRTIDQRDAELWILAIVMIVVLAGGMALFMYPAAFSTPVVLTGPSLRKIFFSFCVLCLLLVGYLMERQTMVRHLRHQLEEERTRSSRLLSQASAELLESLPGYEPYHSRLQTDFERAAAFQQPLSLIVACLKPANSAAEPGEMSTMYVDAVKAMIRKLRGEDSIYRLAPSAFGILLPGVFGDDASHLVERLSEGLTDASGASNRFSFNLRVVNFPEHTASAGEMERIAHSYLDANRPEGQPTGDRA
jgi:GGDEF domain-containing protein